MRGRRARGEEEREREREREREKRESCKVHELGLDVFCVERGQY